MRQNDVIKQIEFEEQEYFNYIRHKHKKDNDNKTNNK